MVSSRRFIAERHDLLSVHEVRQRNDRTGDEERRIVGGGLKSNGHPMNFYRNFSCWTLVFAVLVSAVVCDAFGIWMGWLPTH
jgi:hypothetical protein